MLFIDLAISPQENTGTKTQTNPGNIGNYINGVSLFDYRDGVAWNPNTNSFVEVQETRHAREVLWQFKTGIEMQLCMS